VLAYRIDTQLPAKSSHSRRPCHVDLPTQPTTRHAMAQQQPQTDNNRPTNTHKLKSRLASKIVKAWKPHRARHKPRHNKRNHPGHNRANTTHRKQEAQNCRDPGSNRGPSDLQSDALPAELSRPLGKQPPGTQTASRAHQRPSANNNAPREARTPDLEVNGLTL
jgi:hypothetical protein